MKRIATIVENGKITGVIHGPDAIDQQIIVNGSVWRFDFDCHFGPLWLRRDGEPRKNQCPPRAVWSRFNRWLRMREAKKK